MNDLEKKFNQLKEELAIHKRKLKKMESENQEKKGDSQTDRDKKITQEKDIIYQILNEIMVLNQWLANRINNTRAKIVALFNEYCKLTDQMSDVEQLFYSQVIVPGAQLKLLIEKRRFLEHEYIRIRDNMENMLFSDHDSLEKEIRNILQEADIGFIYNQADKKGNDDNSTVHSYIEWDTSLDEQTKKKIINTFRKIVFPNIHPDTSGTETEEYHRIMDMYRKKDYLLMEICIVKYKEKIESDRENPEQFFDKYLTYFEKYTHLLDKLVKRINRVKKEVTQKESQDPELLREEITDQHNQIRKRIHTEIKKISILRKRLEYLLE